MKQLFQVSNNSSASEQQVLSIALGERHACFARSNPDGNELHELAYCSSAGWDKKELSHFFESYSSLQSPASLTRVAYDFPQSTLVPSRLAQYDENGWLLNNTGFIGGGSTIVTEQVPGWQLSNVYALPSHIQEWVKTRFPSATYQHQYSLDIRSMEVSSPKGSMKVDFRSEDFTVLVARDGELILAQSFSYSTPDDVLYYLLRICQQFGLTQQSLQLTLSGLVDQQSALYKELHQYFIHIRFREASWKEAGGYPAHFFSSLNDLARCAS